MTRQEIDAVLERVRTWPLQRQEDAARSLLLLEEHGTVPYELNEEERADLEQALADEAREDFASDEEVKAVFDRYR